jgi:transcriptional regulator GlxA family with amidase domain
MPTHAAERIAFFLVPDFSLIAFASAIEPLRLANRASGRELYRYALLSPDGGPVRASLGAQLSAERGITGPERYDTVVVCSGIDGHWYQERRSLAWLRRQAKAGAVMGSLCTGAHILARAGLLEGYRCTIHWENLASFAESFPGLEARDELFTVDRNRFTCAGGTAAADLMLRRIAAAPRTWPSRSSRNASARARPRSRWPTRPTSRRRRSCSSARRNSCGTTSRSRSAWM